MNYKVTLSGDQQFIKRMQKIQSTLGYGVDAVLMQVGEQLKGVMQQNAPTFTGKLQSSIEVREGSKMHSVEIGPQDDGSQFPPSRYGAYVDRGGGPTATLPNIEDVSNRLGVSTREGFAFAKYLQRTGKAVRSPTFFVKRVADMALPTFYAYVLKLFKEATR